MQRERSSVLIFTGQDERIGVVTKGGFIGIEGGGGGDFVSANRKGQKEDGNEKKVFLIVVSIKGGNVIDRTQGGKCIGVKVETKQFVM